MKMNRHFAPQLNIESPPNSSTALNGIDLASIPSLPPALLPYCPPIRFPSLSYLVEPSIYTTFTGAARFPNKGSRREGWHYRFLPRALAKQIHWAILGAFFLALLIGVTVAGVLFVKNEAQAKDRNDVDSGT